MEILQLKYFVALAHQEHLTNTAKQMMVTPSAISTSISRLEEELGAKLFDRTGRNICLNDFGKAYLTYAQDVLNTLEDGACCIREMKQSLSSSITLAVWNPRVWHTPIQALQAAHPDISVNQITFDPISSTFDLFQQGVDLIITSPDSFHDPRWEGTHLFDDKILIAAPKQHHLASRKSIDLAEAKDESFVTTYLDTFSKRCYELCQEAGFVMNAPIKCDYTLRSKVMESQNMLCFITYHGSFTGYYDDVSLIQITNPSDVRPQSIFWRNSRYRSKAVHTARKFFLDYYKDFKAEL